MNVDDGLTWCSTISRRSTTSQYAARAVLHEGVQVTLNHFHAYMCYDYVLVSPCKFCALISETRPQMARWKAARYSEYFFTGQRKRRGTERRSGRKKGQHIARGGTVSLLRLPEGQSPFPLLLTCVVHNENIPYIYQYICVKNDVYSTSIGPGPIGATLLEEKICYLFILSQLPAARYMFASSTRCWRRRERFMWRITYHARCL